MFAAFTRFTMSGANLRKVALCLLLAGVFTSTAHAQDVGARQPQSASSGPGSTSYTFDDELVAGGGVAPGLEVLRVRARRDSDSLLRVRVDYLRELCKSVENL
jgi:hypothetical protein